MVYPTQTAIPPQVPQNGGAYVNPIPNAVQQPIQQPPDSVTFEYVTSMEEAYSKNAGSYMDRNEPVLYKKSLDQTGMIQFEVFDLVKREQHQNEGNFVTKDEISAIVAKAVRDEMKRSNRKEQNNG